MIEWLGCTKRFPGSPAPALDSIDLAVNDGEVLGLVGLNGAGKTTAIRAACGVVLPSSGSVRVDGRDIVREKVRASARLGWVPELSNCDPDRKALWTLRYFAGFYGLSRDAALDRSRELLGSVGLEGAERVKLRKFSQGMLKRFALAAAMVGDPENFLLDEVLNGIDPQGIQFVRDWIVRLRGQRKAILLSSHQLSEVQRIADRVAVLHRGRLLRVIRRSELETLASGEVRFRMRIRNLDAAGRSYLESLGRVEPAGDAIVLIGRSVDPATLNAELVRRGYAVAQIQVEDMPLEEFFLRLVGEAG